MGLKKIDEEQLVDAMRAIVDYIAQHPFEDATKAWTVESIEVLSSFAAPYVRGALAQITGQTSITEHDQFRMSSEQTHDFVMALIIFGIEIGRYYELRNIENWSGPEFKIPRMNN